jgi:hypothetical protein
LTDRWGRRKGIRNEGETRLGEADVERGVSDCGHVPIYDPCHLPIPQQHVAGPQIAMDNRRGHRVGGFVGTDPRQAVACAGSAELFELAFNELEMSSSRHGRQREALSGS